MRRGQAMLETALAVLFITLLFLGLFQITHMVTAKVLLGHAAARAARAKAVGFNDWMCLKSARVAMIPVAGRMVWPEERDFEESARVPIYLCTDNEALARGVLEYERWNTMDFYVKSETGTSPEAESWLAIDIPRFYSRGTNEATVVEGEARVESHFPLYMYDQGL